MASLYARWIDRWENKLATRDRNRVVRPFEWGIEWMDGANPAGEPRAEAFRWVEASLRDTDAFFGYQTPSDFRLEGSHLTFSSALPSPYPENNRVHAEYFPVSGRKDRAVVVLPQWNADAQSHIGLCKLLRFFGISALRMSLAYHDYRMPPELERADYHVSSNVGRTIHACRQSVIDARSCLDWLEQQGYRRLGVLGTSLGSCIAFIAAAHDRRVQAGVFNHVSTYFSDVVWTGISTKHVRMGFEGQITQQELRRLWAIISPATYIHRLEGRQMPSLLVWAPYDTTFLPEFSKAVLKEFRTRGLPHQTLRLPCAHYTTGRFPFNWIDGLGMCRFLSNIL